MNPEIRQQIKELARKALKQARDWLVQTTKQSWKDLTDVPEVSKTYNIPVLDKATLVAKVKENAVSGSYQACLIKQLDSNQNYIFIVYAKNRELLPKQQNVGICIIAEALKADVSSLFGNNDVIILE